MQQNFLFEGSIICAAACSDGIQVQLKFTCVKSLYFQLNIHTLKPVFYQGKLHIIYKQFCSEKGYFVHFTSVILSIIQFCKYDIFSEVVTILWHQGVS